MSTQGGTYDFEAKAAELWKLIDGAPSGAAELVHIATALREAFAAGISQGSCVCPRCLDGKCDAVTADLASAAARAEAAERSLQAFAIRPPGKSITGYVEALAAALRAAQARLSVAERLLRLCVDGETVGNLSPTRAITADVRSFLADAATPPSAPAGTGTQAGEAEKVGASNDGPYAVECYRALVQVGERHGLEGCDGGDNEEPCYFPRCLADGCAATCARCDRDHDGDEPCPRATPPAPVTPGELTPIVRLTAVRVRVFSVPCPHCRATVGQPCVGDPGVCMVRLRAAAVPVEPKEPRLPGSLYSEGEPMSDWCGAFDNWKSSLRGKPTYCTRPAGHPAEGATCAAACKDCNGRGWYVGECHPQEKCGSCDGTGRARSTAGRAGKP